MLLEAATRTATTVDWSMVRRRAADIANREYVRWGHGSRCEHETAMRPTLLAYWQAAGGDQPTGADVHRRAWSAAFISYVLRRAGAGTEFRGSQAHVSYVLAGVRNRLTNPNAAVQTFASTEVAPRVGDLICRWRTRRLTYQDLLQMKRGTVAPMHCDLVVAIEPGRLVVIGGNKTPTAAARKRPGPCDGTVNRAEVSTEPSGMLAERSKWIAVLRIGPGSVPPIGPVSPSPGPLVRQGRQVVVEHVPVLRAHPGTPPDLVVRWNTSVGRHTADVDVVVHFHGHSARGTGMVLTRDKADASGLDFADPTGREPGGRTRPTVAVLARGAHTPVLILPNGVRRVNDARYLFPSFRTRAQVESVVGQALNEVARAVGAARLRTARVIFTAHSGGGAGLEAALAQNDPDEIHLFDALYGATPNLQQWIRRHVYCDRANCGRPPGTLRVLYRPSGTGTHTTPLAALVRRLTGADPILRTRYRVEPTDVQHIPMPRFFGWRLLANAATDLPRVTR